MGNAKGFTAGRSQPMGPKLSDTIYKEIIMMKFEVVGLATLCFALTLPVLAQGPEGRRGGFGPGAGVSDGERTGPGGRNPIDRLEAALELTPSQVASAEVLFERRQATQEEFRGPLSSTREAHRAATDSGDPTAIGNSVLAQRELQEKLRAINEEFMAQFRSLLTLEQQGKLDSIKAFRRVSSGRGDGSGRSGRPQGRRGGDFPRPRGGR
jgi:Spy/CpxP family protein refolding chaperone